MDRLLSMMFEKERWEDMIIRADEKGINKTILRRMCNPDELKRLYYAIITEQYEIAPPHVIMLEKDSTSKKIPVYEYGKIVRYEYVNYREVKANEDVDRIVLTLINDCFMELFPEMIHPRCKSYQKGTGCAEVVQECVNNISKIKYKNIGYKNDLSKYFDRVNIKWIDLAFDIAEMKLGYAHGTHPVINMLRKYYHSDWLFDENGNLVQKYTSLKQGSAVAAWLADVILYNVDEEMNKMCEFYVRYSDDILLIGKNADKAQKRLQEMLTKYGLSLNPKKVEKLSKDKWFKFLGFEIKGDLITLSSSRVKKFQEEVVKRTLDKPNITAWQAKKNLVTFLYEGDYNWATSCFSIINCRPDMDELNKFLIDCLRACEVRDRKHKAGKKVGKIKITEIGGLGSNLQQKDRTIQRGKGSKVKTLKEVTEKEIDGYISVKCLVNDYQQSKALFKAVVRGIQ